MTCFKSFAMLTSGLILALASSCTIPSRAPREVPPSMSCPAPGTAIPLGQLVNPSFAPEFSRCTTITTVAKFWAAEAQNWVFMLGDDPSRVVFQVSDPKVGEGSFIGVSVPKAASAPVFSLKKGDLLTLTGVGTFGQEGNILWGLTAGGIGPGPTDLPAAAPQAR